LSGAKFCEQCGHDFTAPASGSEQWEAVVQADHAQFERLTARLPANGYRFPTDLADRRYALEGVRYSIGRGQGQARDIALDIALEDPCVSRRHAILIRQEDGGYGVLDLGSSNGTAVNGLDAPVTRDSRASPEEALRLADGDQVQLGAWTTITVRRVSPQKS
jgi:pSer/pThr/pTyr-binding forkhead associated (FHA) protein